MGRDPRTPRHPPELTTLDIDIFRELQRDGRTPFVAIADRLGVSEAHVRRRTARLTHAQVFSITAVADPKVFGVDCMAWLGIRAHESHATPVAEALVVQPEIDYVVICSGTYDLLVELTAREFELLEHLMRNERLVVSRQALLDDVWGYHPFAETNTVDVFISTLRRKLEESGRPRLIHTVRGIGYVLRTEP